MRKNRLRMDSFANLFLRPTKRKQHQIKYHSQTEGAVKYALEGSIDEIAKKYPEMRKRKIIDTINRTLRGYSNELFSVILKAQSEGLPKKEATMHMKEIEARYQQLLEESDIPNADMIMRIYLENLHGSFIKIRETFKKPK